MGLAVVVQSNLIEGPAARLPADVLLDHLRQIIVRLGANVNKADKVKQTKNVLQKLVFFVS